MIYNVLIGGTAGQGIETMATILQKLLKDSGYHVFAVRDVMSRVRGGHNFTLLRFGIEAIQSHSDILDGIIAFDEDTIKLHVAQLKQDGFILCDTQWKIEDSRIISLEMVSLAKQLGNIRTIGSIAIGALLKIFGLKPLHMDEVLGKYLKEQYKEVNKKALLQGYDMAVSKYEIPEHNDRDLLMISGNQALAFGAIAAGLKFYCAYPMSPSTSIMEFLASKSDKAGIVVEQAEDEIAAINMAIGASFAGAVAMTGTSGGGFCLMVEALGLSGIAEIPLVVVDVQRPGPATGLPTRTEQSDLKFVISASHGEFPRMVIAIRNHKDAFYQTMRALKLSKKYQIPIILLSDQYLADSVATIEPYDLTDMAIQEDNELLDSKEGNYLRYRITQDGISPLLIPGKTKNFVTADSDEHDERGWITEDAEVRNAMMNKRFRKWDKLKNEVQEPEFVGEDSYDTLLLGWGSTYGPIVESVNILNQDSYGKYAALIFGDIYPLPEKLLKEKVSNAKKIINIEQNATGQLADLIRERTGIVCTSNILKYDGRQISKDEIVNRIRKEVLE
ncbi:2-oxoacid:acceptor oxidoreductase subunit alpha [Mobilitalea sibirica]|uniref:2-oxoacid:acceptor oxidoreductase subunit alpha n=1 Tax=Mobilitalea sibirica TaxID=1462919 RepID=A0A8J7KVU4_9FIRM|nr:2-oxoacid:acceptor oxidoreductase subunit alpha [Mobilitalea sibirica]